MTEPRQQPHRRPPACRYDRATKTRLISRDGQPCTQIHCMVCTRVHHPNAGHPIAGVPDQWVCIDCVKVIKGDFTDTQACYTALAIEAQQGGMDGQLVAAAPIPGGTAQVLIGPSVRLDLMRTGRGYRPVDMAEIHHHSDPIPPLAILGQWEQIYRAWLGHGRHVGPASVAGAIRYLADQVPYLADHHDPNHLGVPAPDFKAFTRQVRNVRAGLERALHDEREPELGVECFECGDRLVRRFRDPKRCRHETDARRWLATLLSYPGVRPYPTEVASARLPCTRCSQGGLDDPRAGRGWECPGCRKEYTPGEYATATRRDLLENGDQGYGWIHVRLAAEAATDAVGMTVGESRIRKWMDLGKVAGLCEWTPGRPWGLRLVYWPDVAAKAVEVVARAEELERRRRARLVVEARWRELVSAGVKPRVAAKRLGIDKGWLSRLLDTVAA